MIGGPAGAGCGGGAHTLRLELLGPTILNQEELQTLEEGREGGAFHQSAVRIDDRVREATLFFGPRVAWLAEIAPQTGNPF